MIIKLLIWFIISYGLMNIMVYGSIFQKLRDFFKKWGENKEFRTNINQGVVYMKGLNLTNNL